MNTNHYSILRLSAVESVKVLGGADGKKITLVNPNLKVLHAREKKAIETRKGDAKTLGSGVTLEAQAIFDSLTKL